MGIKPDFNGFSKYVSIGFANTLVHWSVFLALHLGMSISQAYSNLSAFGVAVSLSFYANARYTFRAKLSWSRYVLFFGFMGLVSLGVGQAAEVLRLPALITLFLFSAISLIGGYFYSKCVVFREHTS